MRTGTICILVVALAGVAATLMVSGQRAEIKRLRDRVNWLQSERKDSESVGTENKGITQPFQEESSPRESTSEPSLEVLRLRGEVGRLRRELAEAQEEANVNLEKVRQHEPIFHDLFAPELDPVSNIPDGASTNDVLAELQRAGAQLVAQDQGFLEAGISVRTASGDRASVLIEFYFDGDKLSSKKLTLLP